MLKSIQNRVENDDASIKLTVWTAKEACQHSPRDWADAYEKGPIYVPADPQSSVEVVQHWQGLTYQSLKRIVDGSQALFAQSMFLYVLNLNV